MVDADAAYAEQGITFGPFRLVPEKRLLEKNGVSLNVGGRALDILILLVERAGDVVSKKELIARAWPDVTVDESNLRVHVTTLRKVLGEGSAGARYITNVAGRGYCFVAPIGRSVATTATVTECIFPETSSNLPPRLSRMIGRKNAIDEVSDLLATKRFVTIHGPGGIGKTTVAVAVGHTQLATFAGAVHFLDLGPLTDPRLLPTILTTALGLPVHSNDQIGGLVSFLRERPMLLIFDSCEHLIEATARLAERLFQEAPQLSILATSREALRVEGEYVYPLPALDSPPEGDELNASQVLAYPATYLFIERISAAGHRFELSDGDAPVIAQICRKLDGIALAIELAAARVSVHGLHETAALLDNRLKLLWRGRRTAVARHQTLSAALHWSYDLLSDTERAVLRHLSIFVGPFTIEAAQAVANDGALDTSQIAHAIGQLVAKSLVSTNTSGFSTRYRLLDATRAYAIDKLTDSGEAKDTAHRHARYYLALLEATRGSADEAEHLGNLRIALEWSLQQRGDVPLGIALAATSVRIFFELSLLNECQYWADLALSLINETSRGTQRELELQAALGLSLMLAKGPGDQSLEALTRGLEVAEALNDRINQFRFIVRLHWYYRRAGHFNRLIEFGERAAIVAKEANDSTMAAARSLLGVSYHLVGDQFLALTHLEAALSHPPTAKRVSTVDFEFQFHGRARIALARTLWVHGYPDRAVKVAWEAVSTPTTAQHAPTFCIVLIWSITICFWVGDMASAEKLIERLIAHAERHSLTTYAAAGHGLRGELLVRRGQTDAGVSLLRQTLHTLHVNHYRLYTTEFAATLAEGLARTGQLNEAIAVLDENIATAEFNGNLFYTPEMLRIRGKFSQQAQNQRDAEGYFRRSIELAVQQSARAWHLRTSISLSKLLLRQSRVNEAQEALGEAYAYFSEGFETADLQTARQLLDQIAVAKRHGEAT